MLSDFGARRCRNKSASGRHIKRLDTITASAAGVNQVASIGNLYFGWQLAHHGGGGRDLIDSFTFNTERH